MSKRYKMVCDTCGSENVWSDASAKWNIETQNWEVYNTYDMEWCEDCDGESRTKEIEIT